MTLQDHFDHFSEISRRLRLVESTRRWPYPLDSHGCFRYEVQLDANGEPWIVAYQENQEEGFDYYSYSLPFRLLIEDWSETERQIMMWEKLCKEVEFRSFKEKQKELEDFIRSDSYRLKWNWKTSGLKY
jgi:hypothetical protein